MTRWPFALVAFGLAFGMVMACTSEPLKATLHSEGPLHPWFHLLSFAVLAFLLMQSFRKPSVAVLVVVCLLALAWGTEFREHLADGWPVEQSDVLLDIAGIGIGALAVFAGRRVIRRRN
jgi:hypothetical protein